MFEAIGRGEIKAVWIACTNPAQSMPDVSAVRKALERAELVVVQEAFRDAETCAYADVLLPAASWAEKEGTVTNSERRISRVRAAVAAAGRGAPGLADRRRFRATGSSPRRRGSCFPIASPEEIFNEHRETTRGRDLDITGLSYALLERDGPQQWPYPQGATSGRTRLYADGVFPTPSGRARFVATEYVPPAEAPDADYPLRLTTGRLRDQWHSMTRTGLVARLFSHSPEPEVVLHKDSSPGNRPTARWSASSSRRGSLVHEGARLRTTCARAMPSSPCTGAARFMAGAGTNALTLAAIDPYSKQPELKHAAVRIEPFAATWRGAFSAPRDAELQRAAAACLRALRLRRASAGRRRRDPAAPRARQLPASPTPRPSPRSKTSSAARRHRRRRLPTAPSAPASKSPSRRSAPPSPPARPSPGCRRI